MEFFDPINTYAITTMVIGGLITWFVLAHSDTKNKDKHRKNK